MAARKSKVLWATTKYGEHEIPIFRVSGVAPTFEAWTQELDEGAEVCIQGDTFRNPKLLDEILIHEFVHVIEYIAGRRNMSHRLNGARCTKSAQVLGKGLSQMLREIRQVPRKGGKVTNILSESPPKRARK